MASTISVTQQKNLKIKAIKDSKGNPAKIDGIPTWACDNTDVLALTPSADGMSCLVAAVGVLSDPDVPINVQASVDADVSPGVSLVIATAEFSVVAGKASVVELDETDPPTELP